MIKHLLFSMQNSIINILHLVVSKSISNICCGYYLKMQGGWAWT